MDITLDKCIYKDNIEEVQLNQRLLGGEVLITVTSESLLLSVVHPDGSTSSKTIKFEDLIDNYFLKLDKH